MSTLRVGTSKDLESFLKILAEESVKSSKNQLFEKEDREQSYFSKQIPIDKSRYEKMYEQEEDEQEPAADVESAPAEDPEEDVADSEGAEATVEHNFFTIRDEINNIRSGNSLKVTNIKQNLEQYISRLDDDERTVLHTYLIALARIMHDQVSGSDAQDPSDEPISIDSSKSDNRPEEEKKEKKAKPASEEEEDTSPPIRVNEEQKTESIRRKVIELMRG